MTEGVVQRLLADPAEEPLLSEIRAGGTDFRAVVFTRNRRVMISTGEYGRTLRLNERFRQAPPEVLRAIGRLLAKRRAAGTAAAARAVIVGYLQRNPPAVPRRARRIRAGDRADIERLRVEFQRVNARYFGGRLPDVPIFLSGRMQRRNGHFSSHPVEIVLSRRLCLEAVEGEAEKTLRHEMIHLWQHSTGRKLGHGSDFRVWARRLDIHPRATRGVSWVAEELDGLGTPLTTDTEEWPSTT